MNKLIEAFKKGIGISGFKPQSISVCTDIPFEPEVVRQLGVDFFHVNRGRAISFGTGLKLANPSLRVVAVIGDLMTLGGNHFVHGGRRNMDILVICLNTFVYRRLAGKVAPRVEAVFSPFANFEQPFNIPHLANSCGAVFTARWTALHTNELSQSIGEALKKPGFSVIEVLCPGPNYYSTISTEETDLLKFYFVNSVVRNGEDPANVAITSEGQITVGKFTEKTRPTYLDNYNAQLKKVLGDKFEPYGV